MMTRGSCNILIVTCWLLLLASAVVVVVDAFVIVSPRTGRPAPTCLAAVQQQQQQQQQDASSGASKKAPLANDPEHIRNVAVIGHSHSGKTALTEYMLLEEHMTTKKLGTILDSDPTEASRHSSIFSHFVRVPHAGQYVYDIADTPWGDFPSDAMAALDGADSALITVSAADGVQSGLVQAYQHCTDVGIKMMLVMTKMDRPFVQVSQVLQEMEEALSSNDDDSTKSIKPIPLQVPIYSTNKDGSSTFEGVQSLLILDANGNLQKNAVAIDVDDEMQQAWMALEEAVAMTNDDLLVQYLEESTLDSSSVIQGLREAIRTSAILPLVYTSSAPEKDLGVTELMDLIPLLPNPVELRQDALEQAAAGGKASIATAGVEGGFAARVLHTIVDSFGSLSVLRIISNANNKNNKFESLPTEAVVLRTGEKIKMPSMSNAVGLCGKERLPLADGAQMIPGDVIAVPKLPETVHTNDILTIPSAVQNEQKEITAESEMDCLTPLSRQAEDVALMTAATVAISSGNAQQQKGGNTNKKGKGGGNSKKNNDDDRLFTALKAMAREDLAMSVEQDAASGKLILRCMSSDHLQILAERLQDRYGLAVEFGRPPVPYRETLAKAVKNVEGRHKKQTGGSGQFGVCYIDMEPLEEGAGIEFVSKIKGGVISKPFISSVEKGVREQLAAGGPLGGYPVTDVRVTLVDGKMHTVDSKDIAFQSAGRLAVKAALEKGKAKLLQPMEHVTFVIDESMRGEINTIVARGDGYVTSTTSATTNTNAGIGVEAIIPTASIGDVSDLLRAASGGEAQYTSEFSHYQAVPDNLLKDILGSNEDDDDSSSNKLKP